MELAFVPNETEFILQVYSSLEGRFESALEMLYEVCCLGKAVGARAHKDDHRWPNETSQR